MTNCQRCAATTDHVVELSGKIEIRIAMCPACRDVLMADLDERRRQFDELIAGGMSREMANMVMIGRITAPGSSH
jgi:hypothetical protein